MELKLNLRAVPIGLALDDAVMSFVFIITQNQGLSQMLLDLITHTTVFKTYLLSVMYTL